MAERRRQTRIHGQGAAGEGLKLCTRPQARASSVQGRASSVQGRASLVQGRTRRPCSGLRSTVLPPEGRSGPVPLRPGALSFLIQQEGPLSSGLLRIAGLHLPAHTFSYQHCQWQRVSQRKKRGEGVTPRRCPSAWRVLQGQFAFRVSLGSGKESRVC